MLLVQEIPQEDPDSGSQSENLGGSQTTLRPFQDVGKVLRDNKMAENIPAMMSTLDIGEKTVIGLDVSDVGAAMQRFGWADYVMFFCNADNMHWCSAQEYLVGGRNMKIIPVAVSLIARFVDPH
ncbi:hypothetical protein NQ317_017494 [Molorchus minor]|uniref:Uncharacterized protein n=1 Tax=Molorchus minor TaxID=1323400 RepID=A0ABQ9JNE2_9CUCU|nr:hypothetical protein NQ317_017494 [Molorchus minor]